MSVTKVMPGPWCSSYASLAKLIAVVYGDMCPPVANAAYLYGEEPQNEIPVITEGQKMITGDKVRQVLFCGGADQVSLNRNVYSPRRWEKQLLEVAGGTPIEVIGIPREEVSHTHVEARRLVLYAAERGIRTLYVTAVTPHQIRAFVETVWAILTGCGGLIPPPQGIKVYSKPPRPFKSWHAPTLIAQTQVGEKPMIDTIEDELDRIERYYAKGDLVTCEEVLDYLAWRDAEA